MLLAPADVQAIEARVRAFEAALGIEVVTVVARKADTYPETVWKAFAFGAAAAGLAVTIADLARPDWITATAVLWSALAILGAGVTAAALCVGSPAFARIFLRESRATLEVGQYAKVQFLDRRLFATPARAAVLLVVCLLERRVVILADEGLRAHVAPTDWDAAIARMTGPLRAGAVGPAVLAGLDGMEAVLAGRPGLPRGTGNAFGDAPVEDEAR